ncbi:hypothetical protein [Streptomyces sp. NPDC101455]
MTDTTVPGSARRPHYAYAQAVVLVDGPGGPYEPDETEAGLWRRGGQSP